MSKTTAVKAATPAKLVLIEGEKAIAKALDSIKARGASLQKDCHTAACSVLQHVGKHKDIRLVTRLLESMPDMTRKNAVKAWFEFFGPIAFTDKGEIKYAAEKPVQLGAAMGKPFWSFKPEAAYIPLEVGKAFDSFIKRLEKDHKETGRDHSKLVAQLLNLRPDDESAERDANNAEVAKEPKPRKAKATPAPAPAPAEAPALAMAS
jgi:hypothetical protein